MAAHPVVCMVLAGIACGVLVGAFTDGHPAGVVFGTAAPLGAAIGSWVLLERAHQRRPEGASRVMVKLFAAKLVFFALYVPAVVVALPDASRPFALSFVAGYVLLHGIEASYLRRLFSRPAGEPGPGVVPHV
jgi:hypothetical protein